MPRAPRFFRGEELSAFKLNILSEYIDKITLCPGIGYRITESPQGITLNIKSGAEGGGGAAVATHPFFITLITVPPATEGAKPTYQITVQTGTINTTIPVLNDFERGEIPLYVLPTPKLALPTIAVGTPLKVYVKLTVAMGGITKAEIITSTVDQVNTDSTAFLIVGILYVEEVDTAPKITQILNNNVGYRMGVRLFGFNNNDGIKYDHIFLPISFV